MDDDRSDGIRVGWRLFSAWAQDAVPPPHTRTVTLSASAAAVVASLVAALVIPSFGGTAGVQFVSDFFVGGVVGAVVAIVVSIRFRRRMYRRRLAEVLATDSANTAPANTAPAATPRRPTTFRVTRPAGVAYGSDAAIRSAWKDGREPEVSLEQRIASARAASSARNTLPEVVLSNLLLLALWIGCDGFVVAFAIASPHDGAVLYFFPLYTLFAIGSLLGSLHSLGRTRAALETAPELPDHLDERGRTKTKPYRTLGTDHPDDYA